MNNEVTLEELDKNLRSTVKMAVDNEQKLDEMSRKLGVQEAELKRGLERAEIAEKKLKEIEEELESVGENMKQLEKSAEKAQAREEKLVDKILSLQNKYKVTEARFEYGEMKNQLRKPKQERKNWLTKFLVFRINTRLQRQGLNT